MFMGTILVLIILSTVIYFAVKSMVKTKKSGKSIQCGGDCRNCGGHCH